MKDLLLFIVFFSFVSCRKDQATDIVNPLQKQGYSLVFHDEFNDTTLSTSKWRTSFRWGPSHGKEEGQCYSASNVTVIGGHCILSGRKEMSSCWIADNSGVTSYPVQYTSGMLCTSETFNFVYGYAEIRCRIPSGKGIWPAFWMASNISWPPEIDIFELKGEEPGRLYLGHSNRKEVKGSRRSFEFSPLSSEFHTYAVSWEQDKTTWYLDNKLLFSTEREIPDKPMYLIANLAVGGGFANYPDQTTPFPSEMIIDHIRVYKRN